MTVVDLFFVANILFCLSYLVKDILFLRLISIVACFSTFPYFYFRDDPLYEAIFWQSAFIVINSINLAILYYERKPVKMSEDEERLYHLLFRSLTQREMKRLLNIASWSNIDEGDVLISKDEELETLMFMLEGEADVLVDGELIAHLMPGRFVGELAFLTGKPASAEVRITKPSKVLEWDRADLRQFLDKHQGIEKVFDSILGMDMAEKLNTRYA